jgi:very-short-patch-repair endonuclease
MTIHYNKNKYKNNRKFLRNNSTHAEIALWNHLKNKTLHGYKFRRQYSVDQFILDFYCTELKLAIELDGKIHLNMETKEHDENRDAYLKSFGITIVRFSNDEVFDNIKLVLDKIVDVINTLTTPG